MTIIKKAPTSMRLDPYGHYMYLLIHITTFIHSTFIQYNTLYTIHYGTIPYLPCIPNGPLLTSQMGSIVHCYIITFLYHYVIFVGNFPLTHIRKYPTILSTALIPLSYIILHLIIAYYYVVP